MVIKKATIFMYGNIKKPTSYVIDRIRRRVSLELAHEFNFLSLDDGRFPPKKIDIYHSKAWQVCSRDYYIHKIKNRNLKHVLTFYGTTLNKRLGKSLVKKADIITTVSFNTMVDSLNFFGDGDYRVVFDGVDSDFYFPYDKKRDRIRVLMVITGVRNFKNINAFFKIAKKFPNIEFMLHTFTNFNTTLENVIIDNIKHPISNKYGDSEGLRDLYNSADIYLFTSIKEGLNNSILEAMSCGLPIVAFNTSSMPELIEHEKNGFLCNNLMQMERSIAYLIENSSAIEGMGKYSRKIAQWYSWEKCINGYKEIYEELIDSI